MFVSHVHPSIFLGAKPKKKGEPFGISFLIGSVQEVMFCDVSDPCLFEGPRNKREHKRQ